MDTNQDPIRQFLDDLGRQELTTKTITSYRLDLLSFADWFLASVGQAFAAGAVTPTDIRDYRGYLQTVKSRKPATVNRHLAALRRFFAWACGVGLVAEDPTTTVKGVKSTPAGPRWIEKRELDRLTRTVEQQGNKRDRAIIAVLRYTGIRVGELAALKLDDVESSERKGQLTVRSGKGGKYRVVPLNVDARRAIDDYLEVRPKVVDEHLFIGQRGGGLSPAALHYLVAKYARLAGLTGVSPHTLRHSLAKQALDAGADLVTVAALLGHTRLETTAIYTRPSARDLERAVEKLESE